jgi:glycosyltransferase involved in cell wall biosynthesis
LSSTSSGKARHLLHIFPSFAVGGAQSRLVQLLRAYQQRYRHTIVALDGCYDMAAQIPSGAPVQYQPDMTRMRGTLPLRLAKIRSFVRKAAPDVLVTYNWGAVEWALAGRSMGIARHIHIEDGFGPEERDRQLARRVWFRRLALGGQRTTVVLPSLTLLKIATETWRLRPQSLRYIANGIDCARFSARRVVVERGRPLLVGTVASLRPEKNLGRLIGAFVAASRDRTADLMIVGGGREREALEETARAADASDRVHFTGPTAAPEKFLAQMDIFAMSSDTEQMPLVLLEAMAAGLPVVSTDVGDIADLVAAKNRPFVTNFADHDGLTRSLVTLAENPLLREELGRLNREKALAEFDYRQMAKKYAELFD